MIYDPERALWLANPSRRRFFVLSGLALAGTMVPGWARLAPLDREAFEGAARGAQGLAEVMRWFEERGLLAERLLAERMFMAVEIQGVAALEQARRAGYPWRAVCDVVAPLEDALVGASRVYGFKRRASFR